MSESKIDIAEILHQGDAVARPVVDDFRDAEFRLPEEIGDRHKLRVVLALLGPMDSDESFVDGGFHADDGPAGRAAFDRLQSDGNGRVHFEKLPGGGEDRFGWHGRGKLGWKIPVLPRENPVFTHGGKTTAAPASPTPMPHSSHALEMKYG